MYCIPYSSMALYIFKSGNSKVIVKKPMEIRDIAKYFCCLVII